MGERLQLPQLQHVTLVQRGKENLLVLERRAGIVGALDVRAEKARELEHLPGGPEHGAVRIDKDREMPLPRFGHLASQGSFPDELVELLLSSV